MFRFPGEDDVTRSGYWLAPFLLLGAVASAAAQSPMPKSEVSGTPSVSGFYANSWALVIGINRYERALGLAYAVADAKAVAEALPPLGFPQQNVRLLLDGEATKTRIETVLYEEFAAMASQDRLLVFFAGHGETAPIKGGEEGYLLPVDANPAALARTAIPMDDLKRIGQRVKAKHVLFVMDACFSGFAATRDIAPTSTADEYLAAALREPVVQVLTAGRKGEKAIEEAGHGLFTKRLLDGLRGLADSEGRGILTAAQLAAWIEPRVVRDSKGKMTPQYGKLDGEGQFVFVRPGAQIVAVRPRPELPTPTIQEEVRQQLGSLSLNAAIDGVAVLVGDQPIGETKSGRVLIVDNLAAGVHRVRASKAGYKDFDRAVQVAGNRTTEVLIEMDRVQTAALSGKPSAQDQYPRIEVSFLGIGDDKVGTGFQTHPNGDPDGHFRIVLRTGGAVKQVTGIWVHTSDERGRPVSSTRPAQWWSTTGKGWTLGVERDGKRLNQWDRRIADVASGDIAYDAFADGSAWFKIPGQYFTVGVELADGSVLRSTIRNGSAGQIR